MSVEWFENSKKGWGRDDRWSWCTIVHPCLASSVPFYLAAPRNNYNKFGFTCRTTLRMLDVLGKYKKKKSFKKGHISFISFLNFFFPLRITKCIHFYFMFSFIYTRLSHFLYIRDFYKKWYHHSELIFFLTIIHNLIFPKISFLINLLLLKSFHSKYVLKHFGDTSSPSSATF